MSIPKYYNRVGYVVLKEGNEVVADFRGLNFKFSCEYTNARGKGTVGQASVGILGLTADRVMEWASFCNGTTAEEYARLMGSKARSVSVYAGYESSFTQNALFTLPVVGAWMTSPPDMWLNINAFTTEELSKHVYSVEMSLPLEDRKKGFTYFSFKSVCKKIADAMGIRLRYNVGGDKAVVMPRIQDLSETYTSARWLEWLNEFSNVVAEIQVAEPDVEQPTLVVSYYDPVAASQLKQRMSNSGKAPAVISAETGMIGLPKLTFGSERASQVEVTTLLRPEIDVRDQFYVKSEYLKYGKATFIANKIKHEGEFRGNLWQTTITGRDPLEKKSGKGQSASK